MHRVREAAERIFVSLTGYTSYDRDLSEEILPVVLKCVGAEQQDGYVRQLDVFRAGTRETSGASIRLPEAEPFNRSMPTGHQNSAHRTLPHLVLVTVRADQPVNLVSAFEEPVAGHSGLAAESAVRLAGELASVGQTWGTVPTRTVATYALDADRLTDTFGPSLAFPALLDQVDALVGAWLADGGLGQSETAQAGAR
ncbi:type I-E CRISPR-associated protein Cas7/Cse4/CasC [Streptomyces mirabilis]|uniref:type I-E CRISPR-associated protein Cas7/Cse4/CasC n=1 Tax=Streptomyces mirabilis TaxID=68239 RepID=UPI0031BADF9A